MDQDKDKRFFFHKYGLNPPDVERYLAAALSAGGDYADLYFEYMTSTSLSLDESMVKSASQGISAGCGVRVIAGERTGYAYTDDLAPERILHAARTAALIAKVHPRFPSSISRSMRLTTFIPPRPSIPPSPRRSRSSSAPTAPPAPTIRESTKSAPATSKSFAAFSSSAPTAPLPKTCSRSPA